MRDLTAEIRDGSAYTTWTEIAAAARRQANIFNHIDPFVCASTNRAGQSIDRAIRWHS